MNAELYTRIRPDILASLRRYAEMRTPTGGFLRAVLENNLREAFGRADCDNRETMFEIVSYIYNELPSECWGNEAKVSKWLGGD